MAVGLVYGRRYSRIILCTDVRIQFSPCALRHLNVSNAPEPNCPNALEAIAACARRCLVGHQKQRVMLVQLPSLRVVEVCLVQIESWRPRLVHRLVITATLQHDPASMRVGEGARVLPDVGCQISHTEHARAVGWPCGIHGLCT